MIGETAWFRKLEGEYHYMGESHGAGDVVRLVFEEDGAPVALMTWAAVCYCLKAHAFASRLTNGGDYVLQVKKNQKGLLKQCGELSRIRPLVGAFKNRAEPGAPGNPRDEGVLRHRPSGHGVPRCADGRAHVLRGVADPKDG